MGWLHVFRYPVLFRYGTLQAKYSDTHVSREQQFLGNFAATLTIGAAIEVAIKANAARMLDFMS